MNVKDYIKLFNKNFEEIKTQYRTDFEFIYNEETLWLGNLENKTNLLKKEDDKIAIDQVIIKIKTAEDFTVQDNPSLIIFISKINSIVLIADRINNFVDGKELSNGTKLKLSDLFNEIKKTSLLKDLKFPLNNNLDSFIPHLFSVVKHCQNPQQYPIYYKYWKNIMREVLQMQDDYDTMCTFYRNFPQENRQLNFAAYLGTIGMEIAKEINNYDINIIPHSKDYKYLIKDVINIERYSKILDEIFFENVNEGIKNMKEEFEKYILANNRDGSQKAPSYVRALDLLDEILKSKGKDMLDGNSSIYEIESKILIEKLYKFILKEQNDANGIFEDEEPKSYWKSKFYSAAINSYLNFLISRKDMSIIVKTSFSYKSFHQKTQQAGLIFSEKMVARFVASLCTKPFVICSGLSGSGKTKLAQAFVQWICESDEQYKIIPVGADWTNREPLLGFPNGLEKEKYVKPDSGALDIILKALEPENEKKPFFLILDEMNLSHVERYFADFLSIMESKDRIKLYSGDKRDDIAEEIKWPKNLFIIGTVNIDETTYMFSPKVLDRANVIEFRISEDDLIKYLDSDQVLDMNQFLDDPRTIGLGANMGEAFLSIANGDLKHALDNKEILMNFFKELQKAGAEFGYRSAFEINRLIAILNELSKDSNSWDGKTINTDEFIDIAIMQKLLPKLHGSRNKLTKVLPILGGFCITETKKEKIKEIYFDKVDDVDFKGDDDIIYKLSFEKICRMYKNAVENGYASYAEA